MGIPGKGKDRILNTTKVEVLKMSFIFGFRHCLCKGVHICS